MAQPETTTVGSSATPKQATRKHSTNAPLRARSQWLIDDKGTVEAIVPMDALLDIGELNLDLQRNLVAMAFHDDDTATLRIADERIAEAGQIVLVNPNGSEQALSRETLFNAQYNTRILRCAAPLVQVGPDADGNDLARIHHAVETFTTRRIQSRLDQTLEIPPLPEAARRIIALQADPDYTLKDLVAIIENDPSLAARILGWARSAYYGANPPPKSLDDAVMRVLGFDLVMNMALGIALGQSLNLPEDEVEGATPFWLDTMFAAATMEALARRLPAEQQPEIGACYLAGLLSGFGTLVLGHVFPPQYTQICRLQEANPHLNPSAADLHVLGLSREMIAATLLELWALPEEICDAVRYQYTSEYNGAHGSQVHLLQLTRALLKLDPDNFTAPATLLPLSDGELRNVLEMVKESRDEIDALARSIG